MTHGAGLQFVSAQCGRDSLILPHPAKTGSRPRAARGMAPPLTPLLLLLLAAAVGRSLAQTPPSADCDLLGEGAAESAVERALLDRLRPLRGLRLTVDTQNTTTQERYSYEFRLCGSVLPGDSSAGLVQFAKKDKEQTKVIGRFNATQLIGGSDWILLIYGDGDPYSRHCHGEPRKAMVMISCDPSVLSAGFSVVLEQREKVSDCFYLFELDSKAACPSVRAKLSTGSVLLILFLVLTSVYILGGFLYQRLVLKAKGFEQFPNHSLWQELGNLTADGCDFVFRSKPRAVSASYRGVGSEPLGDDDVEERDEHLLPM